MRFRRVEVTDQNGHKTEFLKDTDTGKLYKRTGLVPRDFQGCQIVVEEVVEQESCKDCIDRSKLGLTDFEIVMCDGDYKEALKMLLDKIEKAPSVNPQPKTGKWIDIMAGDMPAQACDRCNTFYPLAYTGGGHKYCPNCGAKMESEDKE